MLSASKNLLPVSLSLLPVFRASHPARSVPALRPAPLQNWLSNQYRKEQKALPAPDAVAPRRAAASRSQDKTFVPDLRLCQSVLPVSTPSSCGIQDDLDTMAQADEPGAPAEEPAVDAILPAPRGAPQPVLAPDRGDQSSSGRRRFTAACTTLLVGRAPGERVRGWHANLKGQDRPSPLPDGPLFSTESRRTEQQIAGYRARPSPVLVEPHLDRKLSARAVGFRIRITVHIRSVLPRACVTSRCLVITSIIKLILTSTVSGRR